MSELVPISAVTGELARPTAPAAPVAGDTLGKDAFLKLLVAQLKYQNPLSPSDPNQFMAQTAQFTMVEKLEQIARDAATQRTYSEAQTATALLGRQITWLGADGSERTGVPTATSWGTDGTTLLVGDERVPLDRVTRAGQAPTTTTATPTTTTTETPQQP